MRSGILSSRSLFGLLSLAILITGLGSCSLTFEKRHYRRGYHIEVVKNNPHRIITNGNPTDHIADISATEEKTAIGSHRSGNSAMEDGNIEKEQLLSKKKLSAIDQGSVIKISSGKMKRGSDCDEITLKDGTRIDAIIVNIGEDVIAYKKCNFESGPLYSISTSSVDIIHLRNGDYYKPKTNSTNSTTKGNSTGVGEMILSILAFVFALFGFVMCFFGPFASGATVLTGIFGSFGFILGIFGTVFSAVRMNPNNHKFTLAGIILGALAILLFMVSITILVLV